MPFGEDTKELEFMSHAQGNLGVGEPGFFTGFGKGIGMYAMKGFAETARAIDLLGAVPPVLMDKLSGGTTRGDEYFKQHEDVFGNAVDYWTPKAGEVGAAGQIVGSLAGALPQIMINPVLGVGTAVLAPAEDLTKAGVGPGSAITVGMIHGAALAAGIRMPFLGSTLAMKMATGAGGNLAQGILAAAGSKGVLAAGGYDKAAEGFQPFDVTQRTVDVLMGLAFGGLAHLDAKAQAAYRAAFTEDVKNALLVKNQAMQLDAIANAYKAADDLPEHLNVKVNKIQEAVAQALRGEPVNVDRGTQGLFANTPEATRIWQQHVHDEAVTTAKAVLNEAVMRNQALIDANETPGFQRTPEQILALKAGQIEPQGTPELQRAIEIINKPGFLRTPEERLFLDSVIQGDAFDHMLAEIPKPSAVEPAAAKTRQGGPGAPQPESGTTPRPLGQTPEGGGKPQSGEAYRDPLVETAQTIAGERPDLQIPTGELAPDGRPVTMKVGDYLAAADEASKMNQADAGLFRTALTCLLAAL